MNKVLPLVCCVAAIFSVQIDLVNAYDSEIADILRQTDGMLYDSTLGKTIPFPELKSSLDAMAGDEQVPDHDHMFHVPRPSFYKALILGYLAANDYTTATNSFFKWCADADSVINFMDRNNMTKTKLEKNMFDALLRLFQEGVEEAKEYERKLVKVFDQVRGVGLMISHNTPSARNIRNTARGAERALLIELTEVKILRGEVEANSYLMDDFKDELPLLNVMNSVLQQFVKRHAGIQ